MKTSNKQTGTSSQETKNKMGGFGVGSSEYENIFNNFTLKNNVIKEFNMKFRGKV